MEGKSVLSCRGCLSKLSPEDVHSFTWSEIKNLFVECTGIQILPDDDDKELPQQICSDCLSKCEQWFTFKTMCHDVNQHLKANVQVAVVTPSDPVSDKGESSLVGDSVCEFDPKEYTFGELIADPVKRPIVHVDQFNADEQRQYPVNQPIVLVERLNAHQLIESPLKQPIVFVDRLKAHEIPASSPLKNTHWCCPVCTSLLPHTIPLRDHLKEHYSEEYPECPICDLQFDHASKVFPHVISVHPHSIQYKGGSHY